MLIKQPDSEVWTGPIQLLHGCTQSAETGAADRRVEDEKSAPAIGNEQEECLAPKFNLASKVKKKIK